MERHYSTIFSCFEIHAQGEVANFLFTDLIDGIPLGDGCRKLEIWVQIGAVPSISVGRNHTALTRLEWKITEGMVVEKYCWKQDDL